ncbi:MAG TPA: hypothetical protein VGI99_13515 [Gemmataceae bacterium]|jgi:hypothetical protein
MATGVYRGVVRGGVVMLDEATALSDGTEVTVTPLAKPMRNGPALVAAMTAAPQVPKEWVEELERLIEEGQRPPMKGPIFPDAEEA